MATYAGQDNHADGKAVNPYDGRGQLPFTGSQRPTGDDPERQHEDEEHRTRTDGHQGLQDEACVEADTVQRTDTAR